MTRNAEKVARDAIDRLETIADHVASDGVDDVNELVDWIDEVAEHLEDRLENPDQGDGEPLHRGLYLLADTPLTLHPVLTEDGQSDTSILTDMLVDEGVGTFGAARHERELADFTLETINDLEQDTRDGAAFTDVVEPIVDESDVFTTIAVLDDLIRTGEVYAPTRSTLRTTGYVPDQATQTGGESA